MATGGQPYFVFKKCPKRAAGAPRALTHPGDNVAFLSPKKAPRDATKADETAPHLASARFRQTQ